MNRKQGIQAAAFTGIFLILLTMLTYCLRTNGAVKDRFTGFYAEPKNSIDVIMVGSSSVFPYYSAPQMFGEEGIVCYPLSTNLQRPAAQLYLAKEALSRQKPELMVFEVRMYTGRELDMANNMAYTRGVTDNLRYSRNRLDAIRAMVTEEIAEKSADTDTRRYTYYFDIFKYHSNWRSLRLPAQWRTFAYCVPNPLKGFEGSDEVGPCRLEDQSHIRDLEPLEDIQQKHLEELLDFLKEQKQEALFVVSPYLETPETAGRFNMIEKTVTEAGMDFLDLNDHYEDMGLQGETDFSDYGNHTNILGTVKVTKYFEQYLRKHYDLPDRRGEAEYTSWEEAYDCWKEYLQEHAAVTADRISKREYAPKGTQEQ